MENGLYVAVSRQLTLRRELDIVADNIANATTTGFKAERLGLAADPAPRATHMDGPRIATFVEDWALLRDFRQGPIEKTARPLDVAIDGEGLFAVQTGDGVAYARDGRFARNPDGQLVTQAGHPVLDDANQPISLDDAGPIDITPEGEIFSGGQQVARLGIYTFENLGDLSRVGEGLLMPADTAQALPAAPETTVLQGAVEGSNVTPVLEITRMIQISRAYESISRMLSNAEDLSRRTIERLGRVS